MLFRRDPAPRYNETEAREADGFGIAQSRVYWGCLVEEEWSWVAARPSGSLKFGLEKEYT
jgi:hypothetical protein